VLKFYEPSTCFIFRGSLTEVSFPSSDRGCRVTVSQTIPDSELEQACDYIADFRPPRRLTVDVDSTLGCLHLMNVSSITDVSEIRFYQTTC
jgi:hypothetical protein